MLTKQQRVYRWIGPGSSISSDRLEDGCLPHLARAIAVYRRMVGQPLGRVRNAARAALSTVRPDRVEGLVKLLDDAAAYERPSGAWQGALRVRLFEAAAGRHPVLERGDAAAILAAVLPRAAAPANAPFGAPPDPGWPVPLLYADYPEFHRLAAFPQDYTAEDLRADYDLAQAQALLYSAVRVAVRARTGFAHIVRYARLARLLHRIRRHPDGGYILVLDGPNSVLRRTQAYGVDFARFLSGLAGVRGWTMSAEIALRKGRRPAVFTLSDADGLRSRVAAPSLFDSKLEEALARKFGAKREGWRIAREALILESGEALVVPDFLFTHDDRTEVALEIVGYWTPEYVAEKFSKLASVRAPNLVVAVRRSLALRAAHLPAEVLPFSSRILLRDLVPRLEAFRHPPHRRRLRY